MKLPTNKAAVDARHQLEECLILVSAYALAVGIFCCGSYQWKF